MKKIDGTDYIKDNGDRLYKLMCDKYGVEKVFYSCGSTSQKFIESMNGRGATMLEAFKNVAKNSCIYASVVCEEMLKYA